MMARHPTLKRILTRTIFFALMAVLFWWALRQVSLTEIWQTLKNIHPVWISLLFIINVGVIWLFSSRWHLILRVLNHPLPYRYLVAYRLTAFGISYFTPGTQFGGEPAQVYFLSRRNGVPIDDAILSVTIDKLFEIAFNFAFLGLGIFIVLQMGFLAPQSLIGKPAIAILLASFPIVMLGILCNSKSTIPQWIAHHQQQCSFHPKLQKVLSSIIDTAIKGNLLCRAATRQMIFATILSILIWLALVGEYWLMTRALGLHLSLIQSIVLLTAARVAFLFPSPAGLGALESGQIIAMELLGFDATLGLSLSLLIRARDIMFGIVGLWLGKFLSRQRPSHQK